jgi:hypothetical protein
MNSSGSQTAWQIVLVGGVPLLLAVVELFHPNPRDLLSLDVNTWLTVHYAQIALFPLSALATVALVRDRVSVAARICRVAMFIFAVSYVAFDTAAGVVTGILIDAAQKSGNTETWRSAIDASGPTRSWAGHRSSRRPFSQCSALWHYRSARFRRRLRSNGQALRGGR